MLPIGALIWVSVRPLIRLLICVACGFAITKADIFPVVASRGAGQLTLNIALPCLMFSKIVPAFTPQNVKALGPLVFVGFIYEGLGILIALIVKQLFWIPHRFRFGILVAGGWGNYSDIPTSVIMSLTGAAPFSGPQDQNLAVAYISAFVLVFFMTLFPLGGNRMIAWDYVGPDMENDEVRELARLRRRAILHIWKHVGTLLPAKRAKKEDMEDPEKITQSLEVLKSATGIDEESVIATPIPRRHINVGNRHVSFLNDGMETAVASEVNTPRTTTPFAKDALTSRVATPTHSLTHADTVTQVDTVLPLHNDITSTATNDILPKCSPPSPSPPPQPTFRHRLVIRAKMFFMSLLSPPSIAIMSALPIALVTPLKALFVPIPNSPIPNAPDGQPPLAFIQDAASFIGAASVPLGLICLGSALARLKVPRNQWKTLPLGAIGALAIGKMIIAPVLGVLICEGLTNVGIIDPNDKVLRFVCIFFSCLPTATTQVYLTQIFSGTGEAENISAFLIPQYFLMFFSMTILTAYSISLIF